MGGSVNDKIKARDAATKLKKEQKEAKIREKKGLPPLTSEKEVKKGEPFALRNIDLQIPRGTFLHLLRPDSTGSLVCIVGRVATGKTALLSGLINEMEQLNGHVVFGGPVGYGMHIEIVS